MAKLLTEHGKLETLATQEYVNARLGNADSTSNGDGYSLPTGGIPMSDLSDDVQHAIDLANSAVQTESDPVYTTDKPTLALKSELPDISELAAKTELQAVANRHAE